MEEFKSITPATSVVKLSVCLERIYKKISASREKKIPEHQIKEIEFLKTQCRSEHVQLCLMSCQTFVSLAESSILEATNVLNILISMLPTASALQYTTLTEGIISLLLLSLKRKVGTLKPHEILHSNYGLKTQQHPLITLLQSPGMNMNDLVNKISDISNHRDKQIKDHSVEYLRPVYLYILCNPQTPPDAKSLWMDLLMLSKSQAEAQALILELLSWSKLSNAHNCLFTSVVLTETLKHYLDGSKEVAASLACDMSIYQALIISQLVKYGLDPRPSLHCLLRVLQDTREHNTHHYNVLLILLAEALHRMSPTYLPDVLRIVAFVVVQQRCGHKYILNMCLSNIIEWMSQTAFIPADGLALAHKILRHILVNKLNISTTNTAKLAESTRVRYYHPDIAISFDLALLVESLESSEFRDVFTFVDALNVRSNAAFCQRLHLFLCGLFLSQEPAMDCWFKIYETLLEIINANADIAYDFLITYIYKLAGERNAEIQSELLRGLPSFGVNKDNIPLILNTIRNLAVDNPIFCMDLYLRLWRVEPRTYTFLNRQLSQPFKENDQAVSRWEYELAKTRTINAICLEKPTQHGGDLVAHLSDTLNSCSGETGDQSTALALDAIVALCASHTVNITSTWRALSGKFHHERRPRTLKSLYRFFALVPQLVSALDYDPLVDDALQQLWTTVSQADTAVDLVCEALSALKHYEIGTWLCWRHVPPQYRQELHGIRDLREGELSVPGDCWIQLLQHIRPECGGAAADLIAHHISTEIATFRSGVYRLPEGKPEPRKLLQLPLSAQSPLSSVTNYLIAQSRFAEHLNEPLAVTFALRSISKRFPKPIPPLDWSFLHSFFHLSFEARKYCILIATNQLLHSGTSRRLLENFLLEFEPNCFEQDLLLLFSLLPEIANGISLQILKTFVEKVAIYCFKESQLNEFQEGCLFSNFLCNIKGIFTGKCDIPEVIDLFTLIVERYMDAMNVESKLFERYTELVAVLPRTAIDNITSPTIWWEAPTHKLQKATIIRCYLVLYNTQPLSNPLKWLTPVINAFATKREEHLFLYRHLSVTLYAFNNDEHSCNWIMDIFVQIQALLAEALNVAEKKEKALYLIDLFILAVVVLSGCAVLLGSLDNVVTQQNGRYELFPESLQLLCDHVFWKDQEAKIYEFLYNLYKHTAIPDNYAVIFQNAIVCSRNKVYFDNKAVWTKYVGMRRK